MENGWIPQRGSLLMECVKVMELRIQSGEWMEYLPGERRLAELLQVGRDTVRLTLAELETRGWLEPAEAGKRRRVNRKVGAKSAGERQVLKIGFLSPQRLERLNQPMLLEVDHIRRSLAEKGATFDVFAPGWYESQQPERRLEEFIQNERRSAWILYRSSRRVQKWFQEQRARCLVRGSPHEAVNLPFLDVDWQATARHAAGMLWRLGHTRIGILTPPDRLRGVEAAVRGAGETKEDGFEVIELPENGTAAGIQRVFARAMGMKNPPTAFMATRARQIASLFGCAAMAGLKVPDDLSLVSLTSEPFLEYLVPEVSGYRVAPVLVAKQVVRRLEQLVAGNTMPGGNPWLVPDVFKGGSVAPAPDRGAGGRAKKRA